MSEKQVKKLFQGITGIDDDIIEEALTAPPVKKVPAWRRWGAVAACLCLALLAGVLAWRSAPGETTPITCGSTMPGGISPVLLVDGTLYEWARMSVLPQSYQPYGDISGVTQDTPTEDLQLKAGFEASGTVFVSEDYPAVVYVLMNTSWIENRYVRFTSDALGNNELLSWQGRMYRLSLNGEISPHLRELPEGCELIGNLHFIGEDSIPTGDFETNSRIDSYTRAFEGREVYAIPGDDSALYVYEHQYWREGDYPAWLKCSLWER